MANLWNGHEAALSITCDDGRVSQIEFAIPEMTKRGIFGTFFLVAGREQRFWFDPAADLEARKLDWIRAAGKGHEIGCHSMTHAKAEFIGPKEAIVEAHDSKKLIEQDYSVTPVSYCYPYTDVNADIKREVVKNYKQARGGRVARKDKFMRPEDDFDMHNVTCRHIGGGDLSVSFVSTLALEALERKAWTVLMFHTIGGLDEDRKIPAKPWDTVTEDQFCGMLDGLKVAEKAGLWVAPFGTVAENIRQCRK